MQIRLIRVISVPLHSPNECGLNSEAIILSIDVSKPEHETFVLSPEIKRLSPGTKRLNPEASVLSQQTIVLGPGAILLNPDTSVLTSEMK